MIVLRKGLIALLLYSLVIYSCSKGFNKNSNIKVSNLKKELAGYGNNVVDTYFSKIKKNDNDEYDFEEFLKFHPKNNTLENFENTFFIIDLRKILLKERIEKLKGNLSFNNKYFYKKNTKKYKTKNDKINISEKIYSLVLHEDHNNLQLLLNTHKNVNVNYRDKFTEYPLIIASEKGNFIISILLLSNGANPKLYNNFNNRNAFLIAVCNNKYRIVELFLENDITLLECKESSSGRSALHLASFYGNIETFIILMKYVKNNNKNFIDLKDISGYTALNLAALNNKSNIFNLLMNNKANLKIPANTNRYPIHNLVINRNFNMIKKVLKDCENYINKKDINGNTCLHHSIYNNCEVFMYLVINGGNPLIKNSKNKTPLDIIEHKFVSILRNKIYKDIFDIYKNSKGNTFLHEAANDINKILYIIKIYPNINFEIRNNSNETFFENLINKLEFKKLLNVICHNIIYNNSGKKNIDHKIYFYKSINNYNKQINLNIFEYANKCKLLENEKKNVFEISFYKLKEINEYLNHLNISIDELIILDHHIMKKKIINETMKTLLKTGVLIEPILKKINNENDLIFITNKYCSPKKYLETLQKISYFWYTKAEISQILFKDFSRSIQNKILSEYDKSINQLLKMKKFSKEFNIQNNKKLDYLLCKNYIHKYLFMKNLNNSSHSFNTDEIMSFIENWRKNFDGSKGVSEIDIKWYYLLIKFKELTDLPSQVLKYYFFLFNKIIFLKNKNIINELFHSKIIFETINYGENLYKRILDKIDIICKKNNNIEINHPDLRFTFKVLFNSYYELGNLTKCKELCEKLVKYEKYLYKEII